MIIVDSRESSGIIGQASSRWGNQMEVKALPCADFANMELGIGIERKTPGDFYGSVKSGRIFDQALQMGENYKHSYIIISGDPFEQEFSAVNRNVILGAIVSLHARYPCKILITQDEKELFKAIDMIMEKHADGGAYKHIVQRLKTKDDDIKVAMLATIPGLGIGRAQALLKKFNGSLKDLLLAPVSEYQTVSGIGPKLSGHIKEVMESGYSEMDKGETGIIKEPGSEINTLL